MITLFEIVNVPRSKSLGAIQQKQIPLRKSNIITPKYNQSVQQNVIPATQQPTVQPVQPTVTQPQPVQQSVVPPVPPTVIQQPQVQPEIENIQTQQTIEQKPNISNKNSFFSKENFPNIAKSVALAGGIIGAAGLAHQYGLGVGTLGADMSDNDTPEIQKQDVPEPAKETEVVLKKHPDQLSSPKQDVLEQPRVVQPRETPHYARHVPQTSYKAPGNMVIVRNDDPYFSQGSPQSGYHGSPYDQINGSRSHNVYGADRGFFNGSRYNRRLW